MLPDFKPVGLLMTKTQVGRDSWEVRPFRAEKIRPPKDCLPFRVPCAEPLDIEIGCGVGLHPISRALTHPERVLVAIEHTHSRYERFHRRVLSHRKIDPVTLSNLIPVHANAIPWITHSLPAESVDRYFILYPNPFAKRWHKMPFFERLISTLKAGGEIELATNEAFYFEEARRYFTRAWGLEIISEARFSRQLGDRCPRGRTHFERKYLERGETCLNLVARKA